MIVRSKRVAFLLTILTLMSSFAPPASAKIACKSVMENNSKYQENMKELAKQAKLPGNDWNRYHSTAVTDFCNGDTMDVDKMVDNGSIKAADAEAIAKALGKVYKAKPRSELGQAYEDANSKFKAMGTCSACADNIAQYYTRDPSSPCGTLAKAALAGNPEAIKKLVKFPNFCKWKY